MKTLRVILLLLGFALSPAKGADVRMFNTLADLAAWVPSTLNSNFTVRTFDASRPFASARPGHYDATSVASTNLGCVYATSTGVGRNLMDDCLSGILVPEYFGSVAGILTNNTTSPTVIGTDSTLAIQGAIDYLTANGGGQVSLGPGTYWITNTIFLKPRVILRGVVGAIGLEEVRQTSPNGENARMTGASYISGENAAGTGFPLVVLDGPRDFTSMYNASYVNLDGDTVYYYSTGGCAIFDIGFQMADWQFGLEGYEYPNAGIVAKEIAGLTIERCAVLTITGHGVYLYGAQGTTVRNCIFHTTFEPGMFLTYTSDCFFVDNLSTSPFVIYRANTHSLNRNTIYNTLWSWVNYQNVGTNITSWGVDRTYIVERDYGSDAANDTFYSTNKFGANVGTMVYFTGTNLPAPFTTTNMYFVCNGPTEYTIRLATSPKNAFDNTYLDITESKLKGDWSLTSPNAAIYAYDSEEIIAQQNRLDQSFEDAVVFKKVRRSTFAGNQIWEPGLNQTVFRQNKNTFATNVACVLLDEVRNTLVDGNLLHGYYGFSLNNTLKQVTTYGVRSVSSSDVLISGNTFDRLSYGSHADALSVNVRSQGNSSSDTVAYDAFSVVTNQVNSYEWNGVRLAGTNLLVSSAFPAARTNITDFTLALTISDFSLVSAADDYVPLAQLSLAGSTNFSGTTVPGYSLSVLGFQNAGQTNLQLVVSLEGASGNNRRGFIAIREWYDKAIPLELILMRSSTNWYVFRNGYYQALSMTTTNGASPPDTDHPIHARYLVFGGWYTHLYYTGWLHSIAMWNKAFAFTELRDHQWRNNDALLLWDFRGATSDTVSDKSQNAVNGTCVSLNGTTKHRFGPIYNPGFLSSSDGPYLPLAGGAMTGPVTSSSTWQGTSFTGASFNGSNYLGTNFTGSAFTARGTSSGLLMYGRSTVTNFWNVYTGASNMIWYYNPGVGGGYNPFIFVTNGTITTAQGTVWNSGNDGTSSTLDADLLDGLSSASFLPSSNATHVGTLTTGEINYSSTNLYKDLQFNASTLDPVGIATPPALVASSGRDGEALAAVFNANDVTIINIQMPHTWVEESTIYPHLHVEPQTANAITNTWIVKYSVAAIGGTFPAWTVQTNTVVLTGGAQWGHKLMSLPTNGIPMTGFTGASVLVNLRLECVSVSEDTHVKSADVHYRVRGSPVAYTP